MTSESLILEAAERGDARAVTELFPLVYAELRRIAAIQLSREAPGQSLDANALVAEAYLRLIGNADGRLWQSRTHFVTAAAESMRRILIDRARAKTTLKRGGGWQRIPLDKAHPFTQSPDSLLALDEALSQLATEEPEKVELVKLRFYCGLTMPQAATALGVSLATAERWWAFARSWLFTALDEGRDEDSDS